MDHGRMDHDRIPDVPQEPAGGLQTALGDLERELCRLRRVVHRASPAMAKLMQAATEVRAAGIDVTDDRR
jgi:hypothetical protein